MPYVVLDPATATPIPTPAPNPAAPLTSVGLTLGAARAEILAMLKGRQDIEPERIDFWLNRAYVDVATSAQLDELKFSLGFLTQTEQPLYLLPEFTVTTMLVSRRDSELVSGGEPLEKIDITAYRQRRDATLFQGVARKPKEYFRSNRLLVLWPTPDDAYEMILDFRCEPLPLVADTDSPILRSEWHETWLLLARKKILGALAEWEAGVAAGNELASHLRVRKDREADEDENRIVRSSVPRNERELKRKRKVIYPTLEP
jgi:hypothetical protein